MRSFQKKVRTNDNENFNNINKLIGDFSLGVRSDIPVNTGVARTGGREYLSTQTGARTRTTHSYRLCIQNGAQRLTNWPKWRRWQEEQSISRESRSREWESVWLNEWMNRQEKLYRNAIQKPHEVKFLPNKFNLRTKSPNLLKHVPSVHFSNSKTMYIHTDSGASQHKKRHNGETRR